MPPPSVRPRVRLGCTLEEIFPVRTASEEAHGTGLSAASVYGLYDGEQYVLTWHEGRGAVLLREAATGTTLLRVRPLQWESTNYVLKWWIRLTICDWASDVLEFWWLDGCMQTFWKHGWLVRKY